MGVGPQESCWHHSLVFSHHLCQVHHALTNLQTELVFSTVWTLQCVQIAIKAILITLKIHALHPVPRQQKAVTAVKYAKGRGIHRTIKAHTLHQMHTQWKAATEVMNTKDWRIHRILKLHALHTKATENVCIIITNQNNKNTAIKVINPDKRQESYTEHWNPHTQQSTKDCNACVPSWWERWSLPLGCAEQTCTETHPSLWRTLQKNNTQ